MIRFALQTIWYEEERLAEESFPRFEEIRREGRLCDVTLRVGLGSLQQRFSAHRVVLAATIPYFRSMFTSDMLEAAQHEIDMSKGAPSSLTARPSHFSPSVGTGLEKSGFRDRVRDRDSTIGISGLRDRDRD